MTRLKSIQFVIAALAVSSLALGTQRAIAADGRLDLLTPLSVVGDCVYCLCCHEQCENMKASRSFGDGEQEPFPCGSLLCHISPSCFPDIPPLTREQIADVWNRVRTNEATEISEVLRQYPRHVELNQSRNSLQIVRCNIVIAQIPISKGTVAALVRENPALGLTEMRQARPALD